MDQARAQHAPPFRSCGRSDRRARWVHPARRSRRAPPGRRARRRRRRRARRRSSAGSRVDTDTRSAGRSIRRSTSGARDRVTFSYGASTQACSSSSPRRASSTFAWRAARRVRCSGWWSDGLESVVPAWLAAVDLEAEGTVELAALVIPFVGERTGSRRPRAVARAPRPQSSLVTLGRGGDVIELDLASSQPSIRRVASAGAL